MAADMSDFGLEDEQGDSDTETMTAAEVLNKLEEAWLNEKLCPELLSCHSEIVECVLDQLAEMEENIQRAKQPDFKISIHKMEIDRIRFMLSSYLRIRLKKIEQCAGHLLTIEESEDNPRMSPEELAYAKQYVASMEQHLQTTALRLMPANLQPLDSITTGCPPQLDSYMFLKVKQSTDGVLVDEETSDAREEVVDLEEGDQHIMRYRPIAPLVASGAVALI